MAEEMDRREAFFQFGVLMLKGKKYDAAERALMRCLQLRPNDFKCLFNVGQCLSFQGKHNDAARYFAQAFEANTRSVEAAVNAAGSYLKSNDPRRAARFSLLALIIDPDSSLAMHNINVALRMSGKMEAALQLSWKKVAHRQMVNVSEVKPSIDGTKSWCDLTSADPEEELTVVCIKWGTKYDSNYVNNLAKSVSIHLSIAHAFVCFTDCSDGIEMDLIDVRSFPAAAHLLEGWWLKACLFAPEAAEIFGSSRILYVDLDTVIVRSIDWIVTDRSRFVTLSPSLIVNENRLVGFNSSIMLWHSRDGELGCIYDLLLSARDAVLGCTYKFDHWLEMCIERASLLQDSFPSMISDYQSTIEKFESPEKLDSSLSIVLFPLSPKPHEINDWLRDYWNCARSESNR